MDWSPCAPGVMATGDCSGSIHLWEPRTDGSAWAVDKAPCKSHDGSVEDIQWSPTEPSVLISSSVDRWRTLSPSTPLLLPIGPSRHACWLRERCNSGSLPGPEWQHPLDKNPKQESSVASQAHICLGQAAEDRADDEGDGP